MENRKKHFGRPNVLRDPYTLNFIVERDRYQEFAQLCKETGISASEGVRQLIEGELEKKGLGPENANPLGITYLYNYTPQAKESLQSDLRQWLPRDEAFKMIKRSGLSHQEIAHLSQTFSIAATKKRTGYL